MTTPIATKPFSGDRATWPRVVILGAGFGGLSAAKALAKAPVDVTVVDRRNYHLFQPLLYQVATAGLSPAEIATPIRSILRDQKNTRVLLGRVGAIDKKARLVEVEGRSVPYDTLIVATGARHAYFGRDEWEAVAPGLKKIDDATKLRHRILLAFEEAETTEDAAERRRLLTFVIIGGGPTGVELAGAIAELARVALARDFRHIDPRSSRIILVESGSRVLATFPEALSAFAKSALEKLGVEVRLGHPASACDADGVVVAGERIEARTIIWAAGVAASPAAKWLSAEKDRAGRVIVGRDLTLPGHPEIFVIGDTAAALGRDGKPLPGVAPVAKQQGAYAASVIAARITGRTEPRFRYRNYGNLATIGRKVAVADFGRIRLGGRLAWLLWGMVHVLFLIGFRNRVAVLLDWLWAYVTFQRGARLITSEKA
ncbi:MAG TPA: NAD(P)/FAD-dependent oxidoreductase [Stellaceae bacterium]|nr:NAD(P)/FAD-dependent oxidoreductase [Stellaceae bacterium]